MPGMYPISTEQGNLDLDVIIGEPLSLYFDWETADGVAMPMTGFTALMVVYAGDEMLSTSAGDDSMITLTQEPSGATGRLQMLVTHDLTSSMLVPYPGNPPSSYSYVIDLVDDLLDDNVIPLLRGFFNITKGFRR